MKRKISKFLSIILPLLLGFFLISYQFSNFTDQEISEMRSYFEKADYFYVAISLVIALFGFLSRAYRWKYMLAHLGYQPKFHNNLFAVCIAYFINLTIPRSGEISRALVLKKYEDVPFDKAFGTIVAERVVDLMIFLLCVLISLIFQYDVLKQFLIDNIPLEKLAVLSIAALAFMILFILLWIYSKWKLILALKAKVAGLTEGMMSVYHMPDKVPFILHSFFIWITYILMFYATVFALPETSHIGFGAIITAFVFGSIAIGFTNSGFGAYPLLISQIFLLYGIPETIGTAFGWIVWISQTLLIVVLGVISFTLLPLLNRHK